MQMRLAGGSAVDLGGRPQLGWPRRSDAALSEQEPGSFSRSSRREPRRERAECIRRTAGPRDHALGETESVRPRRRRRAVIGPRATGLRAVRSIPCGKHRRARRAQGPGGEACQRIGASGQRELMAASSAARWGILQHGASTGAEREPAGACTQRVRSAVCGGVQASSRCSRSSSRTLIDARAGVSVAKLESIPSIPSSSSTSAFQRT